MGHDAAGVKEHLASVQNVTIAASFGAERDAAFEHCVTKKVYSFPQPHGSVYVFGRDINLEFKHGILQKHPESMEALREATCGMGRISVILWGWMDQYEL